MSDFNNFGKTSNEKVPYELKGFKGIPKYLKDYSTIVTSGKTGNLAVTYLGTYKVEYTITNIDLKNGTAQINFVISNTSSAVSGFRLPWIGYTKIYNNTVGAFQNWITSWGGPMSKTKQTVEWSETISIKKE